MFYKVKGQIKQIIIVLFFTSDSSKVKVEEIIYFYRKKFEVFLDLNQRGNKNCLYENKILIKL